MNEIGEKLKEARIAKGYSLDDLQQITKIQKRYLLAIEEGNLDVLPGNFYARAFIKQYADTVGLNGDQLLSEYTDFIPSPQDKQYAEKVAAKQTRVGTKQESIVDTLQSHLPTILMVVLVFAIALAIYFAITRTKDNGGSMIQTNQESSQINVTSNEVEENDDSTSSESSEQDSTEEVKENQEFEVVSSTGSKTTYAITGQPESGNVLVLGAENGETWVSVTADGTSLNQGLVQNGSTLETALPEGVKTVVIVIGNASVTTIQLNDTDIPYAEEANESVRQEITMEFAE